MSSRASPALIPCKDSGVRALVLWCSLSHTHTQLSQTQRWRQELSFVLCTNLLHKDETLVQFIEGKIKRPSMNTKLNEINPVKWVGQLPPISHAVNHAGAYVGDESLSSWRVTC